MTAAISDLTPAWWSVALFATGWLAGWLLLWRPRHLAQSDVGPLRPPLAVIVPARDEAASLPALLESVRPQLRPDDALIVVDDHSTDGTADIARRMDATVIAAPELPPGWAGKPHACHVGACSAAARAAEILVFVDADVTFAPATTQPGGSHVLDALVATLQRQPEALVSVQPWHTPRSTVEQLSMLPNVLALMGSAAFSAAGPTHAAPVAFGPVLACTRDAYERAGGHAHPEVRAAILEDIALARRFTSTELFVGRPRDVTFRMYRTAGDLVRGWTKGLGIGFDATPAWARVLAVCWVASLAGGWLASPWFALASVIQLAVLARRAGRFSPLAVVAYPVGVAFLTVVLVRSLVRRHHGRGSRPVTWKGRDLLPDQATDPRR